MAIPGGMVFWGGINEEGHFCAFDPLTLEMDPGPHAGHYWEEFRYNVMQLGQFAQEAELESDEGNPNLITLISFTEEQAVLTAHGLGLRAVCEKTRGHRQPIPGGWPRLAAFQMARSVCV